jgi:hypothetical protein
MITLFVGDVTPYLATAAKEFHPEADLVTSGNVHDMADGKVYYTSLGDFHNYQDFCLVLEKADVLVYCPPDRWSDTEQFSNKSNMKYWTEFQIKALRSIKTITGLGPPAVPPSDFLNQPDFRKSPAPQIWSVGCSITHGIGVHPSQRYGQLISDRLNMPVSMLTCPGSSISWAADQILRADIRTDDIVIWGITSCSRFPVYSEQIGKIIHVNTSTFESELVPDLLKSSLLKRLLETQELQRQSLISIHQVINFCKKIKVKLILAGLLVDPSDDFMDYICEYENYIALTNRHGINADTMFLDIGTDGSHPGPTMHAWYADQIMNKFFNHRK